MYTPDQYIRHLQSDFLTLPWRRGVTSYLIFGSLVNIPSLTLNRDIDLCFVLTDRDQELTRSVKQYLAANFIKPDVTIYYLDELGASLPFRDIGNGLFALEYLALGKTIYGRNVFVEMLQSASQVEYRRSLLEKIYDYVLRLRRCFLVEVDETAKFAYADKYLQRLVLDVLLYLKIESMASLSAMKREDIFSNGAAAGLIPPELLDGITAGTSISDRLTAYEQCLDVVSIRLLTLPTLEDRNGESDATLQK
jgi:hypothetical protein